MKYGFRVSLFTMSLALLAFGAPASATEPSGSRSSQKDEIGQYLKQGTDVVQGRIFRKKFRHEFSIDGGVIPNNTFLFYELLQARYAFHFNEGLSFEASYARAFSQETQIVDDLRTNVACPPGSAPGQDCGIALDPPPDPLRNAFFGNFVWSPIYGKFAIFSRKIYHFDLYAMAGMGLFHTEQAKRIAFNVGLGWKVFLNRWAAVKFEVRNITVREAAPFSKIANNQVYSLGASFFLPPKSGK